MAKQRIINTKFWSDAYIIELDIIERYLYLYLLTNEHTNISGVYEIPLRRMSQETGIEMEMLDKILQRFERDKKVYYFKSWVMIKNFSKHQSNKSQTVQAAIRLNLFQLPENIRNHFCETDQDFKNVWQKYSADINKKIKK